MIASAFGVWYSLELISSLKVFFNGDNERGGGSGSSRLLEIVGFSEKLMRVPIPGRLHGTMPAVEVTYLGRP